MAEKTENAGEPIVIKKYANRRLYNTAKSTYVTLDHLAQMVRDGQDFVVNDAKSGEDITRGVLAQIIFEEEAKGQTMLPANFLRQLIRLYGDTLQGFVPGYLEASMETFCPQPGSDARAGAAGVRGEPGAGELRGAGALEHGVVRERACGCSRPSPPAWRPKTAAPARPPRKDVELEELKEQLAAMQAQLAKLVKDG